MIKTKEDFKSKMDEVNMTLTQLLNFFEEANNNGEQFDFCTHPNMPLDSVVKKIKKLEKKWYQE